MAKETTTKVEWKNVVEFAASESGVPKKELEDNAEILQKSIDKLLTKHQPKKSGDATEIFTPFGVYRSTRLPETVVTDANGGKFTRPECCAVTFAVRTSFITAANVGLVDEAEVEKAVSGKKSA